MKKKRRVSEMPLPKVVDSVQKLIKISVLRAALQLDIRQIVPQAEQQARYYFHAHCHLARIKEKVSTLKKELEELKARTAVEQRSIAEATQVKLTVDGLAEKVVLHPAVQAMRTALIAAQRKEDEIEGLVEAYRHRRDEIEPIMYVRNAETKAYS